MYTFTSLCFLCFNLNYENKYNLLLIIIWIIYHSCFFEKASQSLLLHIHWTKIWALVFKKCQLPPFSWTKCISLFFLSAFHTFLLFVFCWTQWFLVLLLWYRRQCIFQNFSFTIKNLMWNWPKIKSHLNCFLNTKKIVLVDLSNDFLCAYFHFSQNYN